MPTRTWRPAKWVLPLLVLFLAMATAWGTAVGQWPARLRIAPGEQLPQPGFPFRFGTPRALAGDGDDAAIAAEPRPADGRTSPAQTQVGWRLPVQLGPWTVRSLDLDIVERKVVPGGDSIGVLLSDEGLLVAGVQTLTTSDGQRLAPSREAGLRPGDLLLRVNGKPVSVPADVSILVEGMAERGEPVQLEIRRGDQILTLPVKPVPVSLPRPGGGVHTVHMIGLLLQDPVAGVGTLSFYDPETGVYGALGHQVLDGQGEPARMAAGRIVSAYISSIEPGWKGMPGEKVGVFHDRQLPLGTIDRNTRFGIFGRLLLGSGTPAATPGTQPVPAGTAPASGAEAGGPSPEPGSIAANETDVTRRPPIPVALAHQVVAGPAQLLTVLHGRKVEAFDVLIEKVVPQRRPADKGLVIRVTDPRLLAETGGIVQGMSGSPVIQQGRLVAIVTHVFVNDPARGYGILAEWMLEEAGLWRNRGTSGPSERQIDEQETPVQQPLSHPPAAGPAPRVESGQDYSESLDRRAA
ncbi:MAG: PDZ domain-containing protein [Limnochordaceae bacterium]|nr:PDZ domain-containing protein [Limnochordaceae bacterium]